MDSLERDRRFRELQRQYLAETREQIVRWDARLATGRELSKPEFDELHRVVHNIKGSGGGYGFGSLTENAARIEESMESGITLTPLTKMIGELLWLHRQLCDDLENR